MRLEGSLHDGSRVTFSDLTKVVLQESTGRYLMTRRNGHRTSVSVSLFKEGPFIKAVGECFNNEDVTQRQIGLIDYANV